MKNSDWTAPTVQHGSELRLFIGQGIPPYYYYLCRAPDIAAVGTIFNVFSYDAVFAWYSNLSPPRRREGALRVEPRSRFKPAQ